MYCISRNTTTPFKTHYLYNMNTTARLSAKLISIIMHPMFMMTYVLLVLFKFNPYLFGLAGDKGQELFLITVVILSVFFPLIAVLMMKALNIIESLEMKSKEERVGPLIVTGIFYLWLFMNIKDNTNISEVFSFFVLGSTIALFISFFVNNFSKISLHSVGMGGLMMGIFFIRQYFTYGHAQISLGSLGVYNIHINLILGVVILLCGLVATSRLILEAHDTRDITGGFLVGVVAQIIAFNIFF